MRIFMNKCSAVCQDRNPADGSCSLTVIQQQKNSLAAWKVCVRMRCAKKQIPSAMFTESFCFIPATSVRISPARKHIWPPAAVPMGRNRSSFPLGTRHVPQMRPWRWRSAGLSYSTTERIKSQIFSATKQSEVQKQSKHYSSYFLPTNVWLLLENTLALRLRQLMQVSPRTRVHWECRREREMWIISGVCFGSCYGLVISTHSEH